MTTFDEPLPPSRRSARQSERDEQADAPTDLADFAPRIDGVSATPPIPERSELTGSVPLTRAERRAREAEELAQRGTPAPGGEPLEYMTQGKDEPLSYEPPAPQVPPAPRAEPVAPTASNDVPTPQFRVRDFSPEGRTTGRRAAPPPLIEPDSGPSVPPIDLEYRTEVGPGSVNIPASATEPPIAVAPPTAPFAVIAPPPAGPDVEPRSPEPIAVQGTAAQGTAAQQTGPQPSTHQTMSRREMRQRLAEESAASLQSGPQPPLSPSLLTGPQNPSLVTGSQNPSLVTGSQPPPPAAPPAPAVSSMADIFAPPAPAPPAAAPAAPAAAPSPLAPPASDFDSLSRSGQLAPPSADDRVTGAPAAASGVSSSFSTSFAPSDLEPEVEHTGGWVAPVGHWSRQADLDDETQPFENTVTREVGGGNVATTTSALVLPEMPRANPFPSALDVTGEVLLTGSIELPRSLSSGAGDSRRIDTGDVDLMFDDKDRDFSATDSAPVSAIRAVSTHTSARGVISTANKPHGNRMLTVLFVTASAMAVGVVALLIVSIAGRLF